MIDLLTSPQVLSERTSEEQPTRPEKNQQHGQMRCGVTADICCLWFFLAFFGSKQSRLDNTHGHARKEAGQFKGTQRPAAMNTSVTEMEMRANQRGGGGTCFLGSCSTHGDWEGRPLHRVLTRSTNRDPAASPPTWIIV